MTNEMTFREAIGLFRSIYRRFEKVEGRPWGAEGATIELVKQVGELAKLVMLAEGYYFSGREQLPGYHASVDSIAAFAVAGACVVVLSRGECCCGR